MKTYKVKVFIEEHDIKSDNYEQVADQISLKTFSTLQEAFEYRLKLEAKAAEENSKQ